MKYWADVEISVQVEVDESKFTPEFMEEFRQSFYPFTTERESVSKTSEEEKADAQTSVPPR